MIMLVLITWLLGFVDTVSKSMKHPTNQHYWMDLDQTDLPLDTYWPIPINIVRGRVVHPTVLVIKPGVELYLAKQEGMS